MLWSWETEIEAFFKYVMRQSFPTAGKKQTKQQAMFILVSETMI